MYLSEYICCRYGFFNYMKKLYQKNSDDSICLYKSIIAIFLCKALWTTLQHRRGLLTELAAKTFYNIDIGRNQEDICKYPCERTAECYKDITEFWYQDKACDRTGNHFTDTCDNGKGGIAESLNHKPDDIYKGKQDVSS